MSKFNTSKNIEAIRTTIDFDMYQIDIKFYLLKEENIYMYIHTPIQWICARQGLPYMKLNDIIKLL